MARRTVKGGKFEIIKMLDELKQGISTIAAAVRKQQPSFDENDFFQDVMKMIIEKCCDSNEVVASTLDEEVDDVEADVEDKEVVESSVKLGVEAYKSGDKKGALQYMLQALANDELAHYAFDEEDEGEEETSTSRLQERASKARN